MSDQTQHRNPFAGSSRNSVSFNVPIGTTQRFLIIGEPYEKQGTEYKTNKPKTWPDGSPKMDIVTPVIDMAGTERDLWTPQYKQPGALFIELQNAFNAVPGGVEKAEGCVIDVTLTGLVPPDDAKNYAVQLVTGPSALEYVTAECLNAYRALQARKQATAQPFGQAQPQVPQMPAMAPMQPMQQPMQQATAPMPPQPQMAPQMQQGPAVPQAPVQAPQMAAPMPQVPQAAPMAQAPAQSLPQPVPATAQPAQPVMIGQWTLDELVTLKQIRDTSPAALALLPGTPTAEAIDNAVQYAQSIGQWPNF